MVDADRVDIVTKAYFDGGWGYTVTAADLKKIEPAGRYRKLAPGIYWFRPD